MAPGSDKSPTAQSAFGALGLMAQDAMLAQQRTLELTQGWSTNILSTIKDQAESYATILRSVEASLVAMEQAVKSQVQATQSLADSLAASRQILESAMGAQLQGAERLESFVTTLLEALTGQLAALRTQLQRGQDAVTDPFAAQRDAWVAMTQDWMNTYSSLMGGAADSLKRADET